MEILFGLLAALCFGVADFLARFSTRTIGVYRTLFYLQCVGFIGVSLYLLLTGGAAYLAGKMQWQPWLWGVLTGCLNTASYLALYRAFATGKLAMVAPIASGYAAITVLLSLLSGESLRPIQLLGVVAVLVGVVLAALHREEEHAHDDKARRAPRRFALPPGVGWALAAALGLGLTFWLLGFAITPQLGDMLPVWLFRLTGMVLIALLLAFSRQSISLPRGPSLGLVVGIGLLDTGAFIASTLGFATGQVAIVSVLASLYSAVAVLLAWIILKERLQVSQWLGVGTILVGVVLTHL